MSKKKKEHITFDKAVSNRSSINKKELFNNNDKYYVPPQVKKSTFLKLDRKGRG